MLSAALTGEFKLGKKFTLRPEAAIHYIDEKQHAYVDSLSSTIASQSVDQGQLSIAPRLHYDGDLGKGWKLRPYAEARGIYAFGDNLNAVSAKSTRLRLEGGLDILSDSGFRANVGYFHDGIGDSSLRSNGFKVTLGLTF